ncbi:MAG TPA: lysylphosphatidylglycerol synthase transmembrane domain-containing protein [Beutenbergiaceae bacterium]|nr:lysylphosphatidylglycerol synthase transmembrane domain-containing protein [Beutenbergiaceae bacterium]
MDSREAQKRTVRVIDVPRARVRRPVDLMQMVLSLVGIAVVLILSVYARGTTTGVTDDVQNALSSFVRSVVLVPVSVIEGLLVIVLPAVVLTERLVRRKFRDVIGAIAAAVVAYFAALGGTWLLARLGSTGMLLALQIWREGKLIISVVPVVTALAALLTVTSTRSANRSVAVSWTLLWIGLAVSIITGDGTINGALITVLLGRAIGLGIRYASGVLAERTHGADLVAAISRAGAEPVSIVRISDHTNVSDLQIETPLAPPSKFQLPNYLDDGDEFGDVGADESPAEPPATTGVHDIVAATTDSATVAVEREGWNRVYAVETTGGERLDAIVLDEDRQVIGLLSQLWTALRLRGVGRRSATNLQQAAERAALMTYAARAAGVNTPELHGVAEGPGSIVLLGEHIHGAVPLNDLPREQITSELMVAAWQQLRKAHAAGLSHRNITGETLLVTPAGEVWLSEWQQGEIASSVLTQRIDLFQLLAVFTFSVGVDAAVEAASQVLGPEELSTLPALVQRVVLPPEVQLRAREDRQVLRDLRVKLAEFIAEGPEVVEPMKLTRFTARTAITTLVALGAAWVLLTTLNFQEIVEMMASANPWWLAAAFVASWLTFFGAALALGAFSPVKLGLWRTTLVQVAASVISLIVPAGVGPAAFNLRFMQRRQVDTPMAVTTVALLQIAQFVTTILLLIGLALFTGRSGALNNLPSGTILVVITVVVTAVGVTVSIPTFRRWLMRKIGPTLRQVWPRLLWVVSQPARLTFGVIGNLLVTSGYLLAFGLTAKAFGVHLSATTVALVYLTGNTVGAAVPTPGGIGAVEGALSTGLRAAGIATAAALSISVVFRVLTFWARVPVGWLAWRFLQRKGDI